MKQPLIAVLKTSDLQLVSEHELPEDVTRFPECIELPQQVITDDFRGRLFFRFQISDHRGFYREGDTYRISL